MAKKYLIIGASSGIGEAIAKSLASEGHELYTASRSAGNVGGENFHFQSIDVSGEFELELPEVLDGLVYCPGSINLKPFHRLKEEDFTRDLQLNLLGAIKCIQQALPALKANQNASIVLFSTVAVQTGMGFHSSVAASKGAIEGLGKALAAELAPSIRVNVVAPSLTDTPLAGRLLSSEEKKLANAERHPLKKIGTPEEVANAALFLLSEKSNWTTGQVLKVDGGLGSLK